ncbi:gliding motility-associated C-terminal domain-containing protein, partial [Chitinophaga sp.]
YKNTWDGKCNEGLHIGEDVPDGTYYYIIILNDKDRFVNYITIMR